MDGRTHCNDAVFEELKMAKIATYGVFLSNSHMPDGRKNGYWRRDFFCARTQIAKWWSANGRLHISKVMETYEKI